VIVIVGAGPAGLAIAYELQRRKLPFQVIEQGQVGESWRHHYDRLHLHTLKDVSGLPGLPMSADYPRFPSGAEVHAYFQAYATHFDFPIRSGVRVEAVQPQREGWRLETSAGQVYAEILVLTTGIWHQPYVPPFAGLDTFQGLWLHSSRYRNAEPFRGQRVLVVGVGNSGSEIAVDLMENGVETAIAIRSGATFVPYPTSALAVRAAAWGIRHAPSPLAEGLLRRMRRDYREIGIPLPQKSLLTAYPVVGYQLPEAVAAGRIARYGGVSCFTANGVVLDDGCELAVDSAILATGYRPALRFMKAEVVLDGQGRPHVDHQWRSVAHPRLFCVGYHYPANEGWLQAIGRVANAAATGIAATMRGVLL
jgi:cation diffusion facilitator CzcD-associated flavoprotein CzcO